MNEKILKTGYSTGSHATSALMAALTLLAGCEHEIHDVEITLPDDKTAILPVKMCIKNDDYVRVDVIKGDNDDIDVTKGCKIICYAGINPDRIPYNPHPIEHKPYHINKLFIYAGKGLGVVTKEGLKPPVGYPAINPATLDMMKNNVKEIDLDFDVYVIFEVEDGKEIAKNTANLKAGVVGGISFLGKKGIVKPISTDAYLESIEAEINVAINHPSKTIVLTMGNDCLESAKAVYGLDPECYIEIGNFVYDTLALLKDKGFSKVVISANIGKLTKIAQGKKNTNNRYGGIDFYIIKSWLGIDELPCSITTVGAVEEKFPHLKESLYQKITYNALEVLKNWLKRLNIEDIRVEILFRGAKKC